MNNEALKETFKCLATTLVDKMLDEYDTRLTESQATIDRLDHELFNKEMLEKMLNANIDRLETQLKSKETKLKRKETEIKNLQAELAQLKAESQSNLK